MQDTVIVGAVVAGEAAAVRKALVKLIKQVNTNTFDIAQLLHTAKAKHLYTEPTFAEYAATFDIKVRKAQYLERIVDVMEASNITREEYEPIGVTKLRVITRLSPTNEDGSPKLFTNPATKDTHPMADYIVGLVEMAPNESTDELEKRVHVLMGETGENDMTWLNIRLPRLVMENTIAPALEKAAINIGTVHTDSEGMAEEVSDWRKLEVVCVEYVNDKNSDPEVS